MKSIAILTILILGLVSTVTAASQCQIKLIDDDSWGQQNKVYNSRVKVSKLPYDLRQDVKEIWLKNWTPYPCKYSLYTCKQANFRSCKKWTGTVGSKSNKPLRSSYIKKMVSIKGSHLVQKPKPVTKPVIPKIALPKIPKIPIVKPVTPKPPKPVPKNPKIPKLPLPAIPKIPGIKPAIKVPTPPGKAAPNQPKPIEPKKLDPAQQAAVDKGKIFCSTNCVIDNSKIQKKCLVGTKLVGCKRCTAKPGNKDAGMKTVCETVCNANVPASPCDFYGYLNNQKKKANTALLAKYGLSILRKFKKF